MDTVTMIWIHSGPESVGVKEERREGGRGEGHCVNGGQSGLRIYLSISHSSRISAIQRS